MVWWKDRIREKMEIGREIGRRKRLEHNEKVRNFFGREKKKDEDTK